ncbi:MAG: hypothetical protein NVS9B4_26180 [Candidatus Acidiferrum sp.]
MALWRQRWHKCQKLQQQTVVVGGKRRNLWINAVAIYTIDLFD